MSNTSNLLVAAEIIAHAKRRLESAMLEVTRVEAELNDRYNVSESELYNLSYIEQSSRIVIKELVDVSGNISNLETKIASLSN